MQDHVRVLEIVEIQVPVTTHRNPGNQGLLATNRQNPDY